MIINVILPYKEIYDDRLAGAVSIFVSNIKKKSKFKKNIKIFGSSLIKKPITDDYYGLKINKPFYFYSKTLYYLKLISYNIINNNQSVIEIHNRPQAALYFIKKKPLCKKILFFHNDPNELRGSDNRYKKLKLFKKLDKLIFVSEWCKRRFFENLNISSNNSKAIVINPGINPVKKIPKKKKIITFAGKLNESKGYNLFIDVIEKILKLNKDWRGIIIGDDPRAYKKIILENLEYKGWITHSDTLKILGQNSIELIIPIRNEPFGRTALEAASCGCATVLTKKGGIMEANSNGIFLKKIDSYNLFKEISHLIGNKKERRNLMIKNLKNFKITLKRNVSLVDEVYQELI
jgi:glycosyltransferase involved in cell wall biosynthesis